MSLDAGYPVCPKCGKEVIGPCVYGQDEKTVYHIGCQPEVAGVKKLKDMELGNFDDKCGKREADIK